ncbi:MAG TPA: hydantoinase/oxoprolinase family protein [Acidimicrobiales bacterium]|nr:hydantoinase/oxoprolinase family protein [Acidimicrobiales bacterium]
MDPRRPLTGGAKESSASAPTRADAGGETARWRVGVDTGGTFTDFVLVDQETGAVEVLKVPSTPDDPGDTIVAGLPGRGEVVFLCHGTTVGTNALLEEKGARTGLVVTEGFRGVYEIMEQARPYGEPLFDLRYAKPRMLAHPAASAEAPERVGPAGEVLRPLDEAAVREGLRRLARRGVESLAVCLLFSFLAPEHERRIAAIAAEELPGCPVSLSSDVLPEIREYYRLSTTVINAYLRPVLAGYLERLESRLGSTEGRRRPAYVMQSNGGMTTFAGAARRAATALLSGPAGGVIAGARLTRRCGFDSAVTFDMGGTSCDVALVTDGEPAITTRTTIGDRHVALPMIDVVTVGAGGGTLARVAAGGLLEVGPESAGAVPGPACYGRGGDAPTVTDANLHLGYLSERNPLAGSLELSRQRATEAIARVAAPLGLDVNRAAQGIVDIVDARMEEAIRSISTMRGHDVRDFVLIAFGGAGPLHAGSMLDALGMRAVVVPANPGVFSAMGLLQTDVRRDVARSKVSPLESLVAADASAIFAELESGALGEFEQDGIDAGNVAFELAIDLRYRGQGYELTVAVDPEEIASGRLDVIRKRFDHAHEQRFGSAAPDEDVEVVTYRIVASAAVPRVAFAESAPSGRAVADAVVDKAPMCFDGAWRQCAVYARHLLGAGDVVDGPAVIAQMDSTTLIRPGHRASVDRWGNLVIEPR